MFTTLVVRPRGGQAGQFAALLDTGSSVTILSHAIARLLGLKCKRATDRLDIGGAVHDVCYRTVDLHIPGTDCLIERMRVAVIVRPDQEIPGIFIGADFLQRAGAFLDFRKGQHAVGCDLSGRDQRPRPLVKARPHRLVSRRR